MVKRAQSAPLVTAAAAILQSWKFLLNISIFISTKRNNQKQVQINIDEYCVR